MSRIQLVLNVDDLDVAIKFYSKLFSTSPAKIRPGYANFAVADPLLKLVLIENKTQAPGSINHLGSRSSLPRKCLRHKIALLQKV